MFTDSKQYATKNSTERQMKDTSLEIHFWQCCKINWNTDD